MAILKKAKALALLENIVPDGVSHTATAFVESLKINSISEKTSKGRRVVIKRRNHERVPDLINFYFRLADIPIRFLSDVRDWRRWEAGCFKMLNGDRFRAIVRDARTVIFDKLPGQNLWDHMNQGTLTARMLTAAGHEFRRAHRFHRKEFGSAWSHGDASMPNVVYDKKTDRARLIDFEIRHVTSLPAVVRHADDLLVFLLDMVGRISTRRWLPFALKFLRAYDDQRVIAELKPKLVLPNGLALIWWNVRTNFAKSAKIERRFRALRRALGTLELRQSTETDRRKTRRPSMNCHAIKAGIPTARSRIRVIKEMAKAASPGMRSKLPSTR